MFMYICTVGIYKPNNHRDSVFRHLSTYDINLPVFDSFIDFLRLALHSTLHFISPVAQSYVSLISCACC